MSHYRNGADFERDVRASLVKDGYEVIRSAGSKTKVDLVAFKTGEILFVQCKANGLCAPAERAELIRLAGMVGALPIVAYKHKEGRAAAVPAYRLLTGPGPKEWAAWSSDRVDVEASETTVMEAYRSALITLHNRTAERLRSEEVVV